MIQEDNENHRIIANISPIDALLRQAKRPAKQGKSVLQDQIGWTGFVMRGYGLLESEVHAKFANESEHERIRAPIIARVQTHICPPANVADPESSTTTKEGQAEC